MRRDLIVGDRIEVAPGATQQDVVAAALEIIDASSARWNEGRTERQGHQGDETE